VGSGDGKIVALDTSEKLISNPGAENRILFVTEDTFDLKPLQALSGVTRIQQAGSPGEPSRTKRVIVPQVGQQAGGSGGRCMEGAGGALLRPAHSIAEAGRRLPKLKPR
jgi:hypothetical protein